MREQHVRLRGRIAPDVGFDRRPSRSTMDVLARAIARRAQRALARVANGVEKIRAARRIAARGTNSPRQAKPDRTTGRTEALRTVVLIVAAATCPWRWLRVRSAGGGVGADQAFERTLCRASRRVVAEQASVVVDDQRHAVDLEGAVAAASVSDCNSPVSIASWIGARQLIAPAHFDVAAGGRGSRPGGRRIR